MRLSARLFACAALFSALRPAAAQTLAAQTLAAQIPDTAAVAVVRQFLTAHAAGHPKEAYALLSAASRQGVSSEGFAADLPPQFFLPGPTSDPVYGIGLLFNDPKNTQHSTYTVVSADALNPALVLVSWTAEEDSASTTLRLRTVTDPATKAVYVDMLGSVQASFPPVPPGASRGDKNETVSQRNLTVLAFALLQYARSHHNRFPDAAHWTDALLPFVADKSLFHDPFAPAGQKYSYAFNRNLSHQPFFAVPYPGLVILLYQSTKGVKNDSGTGQSLPPLGQSTGYAYVNGGSETEVSYVKNDSIGSKGFNLNGK